jgi:hypothetical protein
MARRLSKENEDLKAQLASIQAAFRDFAEAMQRAGGK